MFNHFPQDVKNIRIKKSFIKFQVSEQLKLTWWGQLCRPVAFVAFMDGDDDDDDDDFEDGGDDDDNDGDDDDDDDDYNDDDLSFEPGRPIAFVTLVDSDDDYDADA